MVGLFLPRRVLRVLKLTFPFEFAFLLAFVTSESGGSEDVCGTKLLWAASTFTTTVVAKMNVIKSRGSGRGIIRCMVVSCGDGAYCLSGFVDVCVLRPHEVLQ